MEDFPLNETSKVILGNFFKNREKKEKIKFLLKRLGLNFSYEAIYNIFYVYLQKNFLYSFNYLLYKEYYNEEIQQSINSIYKIIYKISGKYGLKIPNIDDFIVRFHNSSLLFNTIIRSNEIFYNRNRIYVEKMKLRFPNLVEDILGNIREYLKTNKEVVNEVEVIYLAFVFMSNWVDLVPQLYDNCEKIKALVVCECNYPHSISIKNQLDIYFYYMLDVHIYEEKILDLGNIENSDYDLIFSNTSLPRDLKKKWLYINGNQTRNDFNTISNLIYNMFIEKNKIKNV